MKSQIKNFLSFILHGAPPRVTAQISLLKPNHSLVGKKIIVTGGGRGLGYAMAKKFLSEGANVLIAGRNESTLKDSAKELNCDYLVLDIKDINSFETFFTQAHHKLGGINSLVNNAGLSLHEKCFLDVTVSQYDSQFDTNLKGTFFLTSCFIKYCQKFNTEEFKNIIFMSSETSITVDDRPYGLTKAALNSLVQGLASKYVNDKFRINALAPGITASEMTGYDPRGNLYLSSNPSNRVFLPEEIAEVASFLLSDASNIINGQILVCNEGKTINTRW